jgi:trk system potassium uptake protein
MKAVIVGCGRVGAGLADALDRAGWQVLIIDRVTSAFDRLPSTFGGTALRGDGTDEDTLRRFGGENADMFLAATEGDNRNIMAAQLAVEALGASRTMAKINDPVRAEAYAHLGIATLCRTNLMTTAVLGHLGQGVPHAPGIYLPEREHSHAPMAATEAAGVAGATEA